MKCPRCNSPRYEEWEDVGCCRKCGYMHYSERYLARKIGERNENKKML